MIKTAVITGGSGGIGLAIANQLSTEYRIILQYHKSLEKIRESLDLIKQNHGEIIPIQADLSTEAGCRKFHEEACSASEGQIDVLVNNAGGIIVRHTTREITWEILTKHFALNTYSTMMLSSLFIDQLEKSNNANIINITSGAIRNGSLTAPAYGAAKGAVDVFTRGLAHELAPKIRVNAIAPGVIQTQFYDGMPPEILAKLMKATPLGKLGTPDDVAHTVRFLIENTYMTGETIDLNGGLVMR